VAQAASFDKAIAQLYRDHLELLKAFGDFGKLVQEAAGDVTLRQRLVQAPQQVLLEGIPLPIDTEIQFLANTSYRLHLLLPALADKAPAVATPNPVKRAMARACGDPSYRALLVNEPRRAFAEENCKLPEGVVVSVREMSNNKLLVVLPEHPDTIFGERTVRRPKGSAIELPPGLSLEWHGSTTSTIKRMTCHRKNALANFPVRLMLYPSISLI